jgi:plastocyanin
MHTDLRSFLRLVAGVFLTTLAISCGGGSSPAGPSPQNSPGAAAPTLSSVSPGRGATGGGLGVTISGSNFVAGATVSIGGAAASGVTVGSATSITATTPPHAAGAADIVVTNPDGQSGRLSGGFNYETPVSAPPAVASVGPSSGPAAGGTSVSIAGSGFASGATVSFGSIAASSVSVANATAITAVAPAGSAGKVDVVVTNPDGQTGRLAEAFTYVAQNPPSPPSPPPPGPSAPTLNGVAPSSGSTAGGTAVTLSGSGFVSGATVTFGGTAASNVTVSSGGTITATTPARAAGTVDVVVTNPDGQTARLAGGFTYEAPAPPPGQVVVVTITSAGVSTSSLIISPGTRVRFVNNDTVPHEMTSDPHPSHVACPALNVVGLLLAGQSRESSALTTIQTCGYHDHRDPDDPRWSGTVQVR